MGMNLASAVQRHIARVRNNPATAVDPGEIEELERYAHDDTEDFHVARTSPVAKWSYVSRVQMGDAGTGGAALIDDESDTDTIDSLGEPVEIVGFDVSILQLTLDTAYTPTPIEAIDVQISRTKGGEEVLTNANQQPFSGKPRPLFVPLRSVSATIANRMFEWKIDNDQTLISLTYRWAVDAATRTALNYGAVQISTTLMYRLLRGDER